MKVADMHCDTISELYKNHLEGGGASILENDLMLDLKKMRAGDYGIQNFALYTNLERAGGRPFEYCMELLDTFYTEMEAHQDE
ncbi:MAG: membrane dipeptidase, partial [Clostridiales bacterium]|nr:membrane dipeptidase [Clostridiales bacterium]